MAVSNSSNPGASKNCPWVCPLITTPQNPSSAIARLASTMAAPGSGVGRVAKALNRSGWAATASAHRSLSARLSPSACSAGTCWDPGATTDRICMSIPASSMTRSRCSSTSTSFAVSASGDIGVGHTWSTRSAGSTCSSRAISVIAILGGGGSGRAVDSLGHASSEAFD
jgi:hypothetical protein